MQKGNTILLSVLTVFLVFNSTLWATDYMAFTGFNDDDYQRGKYKLQGLIKALDDMGLNRIGYWWSAPYHFWENALTTWPYDEQLDSAWADYPCLTCIDGNAGTYRDDAGQFFFVIETREEWKGTQRISNLEKYGAPMRLGESFFRDSVPGNCRYVMVLGSNALAVGPNRSSWNSPNYSRPDLFQQDNPAHANPFKIWGPVMTDGVRLVMGFTGHAYAGETDYENWKRFKYYHDNGFSIAWSFANAAMDADDRHIPVALAQGASFDECVRTIDDERWFVCKDPESFDSGRPGTGSRVYRYWHSGPLANEINFNSTDESPMGAGAWAGREALLKRSGYIYESMDSRKREAEAARKYLAVFGLGERDDRYETLGGQTTYHSDRQDAACVDSTDGSFLYRNPHAYEGNDADQALTRQDCIARAHALLVDHDIVAPEEVTLDRVVAICQAVAPQGGGAADLPGVDSEVLGYVVVFKRRLGNLPLLSNQVDTIKIEMTRSGEVASLVSNYKHGRILTRCEPVEPARVEGVDAEERLAGMGAVEAVEAGWLALENGDYVPVYKVTTLDVDSTPMRSHKVRYLQQDTLMPVSFRAARAVDGPEAEADGLD